MRERNPFVIADIGSNHRNSLEIALKQVERAAEAKVNAVKFQLYTHKDLYGVEGETPFEFKKEWLESIKNCADKNGVEFMCSAFSVDGLCAVDPYVTKHKIASCEMKYVELLDAAVDAKKQIIISTGGAHWQEIEGGPKNKRGERAWCLFDYFDKKGVRPWIMECVAAYPALTFDYNLTRIPKYVEKFGRAGLSDHTKTNGLIHAATQFGATVFEVHFDGILNMDKTPDSPVSLGMVELSNYVFFTKLSLSRHEDDFLKRPVPSEAEITEKHRRRLKITKETAPGEILHKGVNYGAFRSLEKDSEAHGPEWSSIYEGRSVKVKKAPQEPLFVGDV